MSLLEEYMVNGVFAFMLCFARIGAAVTIMPGVGDSFTPANIRLYIALGLALTLAPLVMQYLPDTIPPTTALFSLILMEFIVGLLFGTIARIFMAALDTAGMIISTMSGLGNAQVFNPGSATQGSLIGALLSVTGMVIIFATELHHLLFLGIVGSYDLFPVGTIPNSGDMAQLVTKAVSASFLIGLQLSLPFILMSLMIYVGMGVLTRLMPQIQVFILALPLQIMIAFITLMFMFSAIMLFWVTKFEEGMIFFFGG